MKFEVDNSKGRLVISQAVIMKVLGISDLVIERKKFPWIFDIRHDKYGKIYVRQASARGNGRMEVYRFIIENNKVNKKWKNKIEYDTYFLLGFSRDWKSIERLCIIPNKGWIEDLDTISIYKNTDLSKYDEFKVDHIPYYNAFNGLMLYIGDVTIFDIDDIKDWLKS
jgi:hypothetical protein